MTSHTDFNPDLFGALKHAEQSHFWFKARRTSILDRVRPRLREGSSFLEAGCGTGNVSSFLASNGYRVTGCELHESAFNHSWDGFQRVQGSALELPFLSDSFDGVGLFDALEHFDNDAQAIAEALRVLKKDGFLFVTVPARMELWSSFDDYSRHKRRYHPDSLKKLFADFDLSAITIEYLFLSLYIPALITRTGETKDPFVISAAANMLFASILSVERRISQYAPLPIGTSLIGIARK